MKVKIMDAIDLKLVVEAEKGLPLTPEPFSLLAANAGVTVQDAIGRLQKLQNTGVIRRFGVSIRPNGVGFYANAMVAWKVPNNHIVEVSDYFCKRKEVTHCYERKVVPGKWEYNLYTVMHAQERSTIEELVKKFSNETSLSQYVILYSSRNLKLTETKRC